MSTEHAESPDTHEALEPTDESVLDNPTWHALTTTLAGFATGTGRARRMRPDVSAFSAIDESAPEAWRDLTALCTPAEVVIMNRVDPISPAEGWLAHGERPGYQMVFRSGLAGLEGVAVPDGIRRLEDADVPQMLELIALTEPGPFRPRTIELGNYHGIFHGEQLMAMAGQRINLPRFTEISAVCTHPDARRRGYAAAISAVVARCIIDAGKTPILHVAENNDNARRVYETLGFETRTMMRFAALQAPAA